MKEKVGPIERWGKGIILSLYVPLGAAFLWTYSAQLAHNQEATQRSSKYADNGQQYIARVCLRQETRGGIAQCVAETAVTAREQQRRETEVQAQEETAAWTRVTALLAFFALGASITGIWAVWRTIKQGQEANAISRQAMKAQMRAWISVEIKEAIGFRMVNDAPTFVARFEVKNIGQTPAIALSYFMSMAINSDPKTHIDADIASYKANKITWTDANLFPGQKLEERATSDHEGEPLPQLGRVSLYVLAAYRTVFSDEMHFTAQLVNIEDGRRDDGLIDFKSPPFGTYLRMVPNGDFVGYAT